MLACCLREGILSEVIEAWLCDSVVDTNNDFVYQLIDMEGGCAKM